MLTDYGDYTTQLNGPLSTESIGSRSSKKRADWRFMSKRYDDD